MEEWKDVPGYEGIYQVSNFGNIKSLDRCIKCSNGMVIHRKGSTIKKQVCRFGYENVTLRKPKEKKTFKVHRLVALAFIDNPNNYPEINHKDENKLNNSVENLEWCTREYNLNYGTFTQRRVNSTDYKKIWDLRRSHFGRSGGNKKQLLKN